MERRDLSGQVLDGRYHVIEPIGRGAMGSVFRADDRKLGRAVAVKIMNEHVPVGMAAHKRFEREAQAMAKLEHPHCAKILDVGVHDEQPFVVMDLVVGTPLDELVAEGPLPIARAVGITRQILFGLAHAHEHGIIHRDIKPANVVLSKKAGVGDHVKILDFGLAKLNQETSNLTAGVVVGTPSYMSPEQIRGLVLDARSDVYACGVLLYELLTGIKPFRAPNNDPLAVCMAHLNDPVPTLASARPGVDFGALEDAIAHALAKNRDHRFGSAMAFANALGTVGSNAPVVPRAPTPRSRPAVTTPLAIVAIPARSVAVDKPATVALSDGDLQPASLDSGEARAETVSVRDTRVTTPFESPAARAETARATTPFEAPAAPVEPARATPPAPAPAIEPKRPPSRSASPADLRTPPPAIEDPDQPIHISIPIPPASNDPAPALPRPSRPPPRRSRAWLVIGLLAVGGAAAALVVVTRKTEPGPKVTSASVDAGVARTNTDAPPDRIAEVPPADAAPIVDEPPADAAPEVDAAPTTEPPPPADDLVAAIVARADQLVAQRRREQAIDLLVKARKSHPKDARLPYRAGLLYLDKMWWPDGLKQLRAALALDPKLRDDAPLITAGVRAFSATAYYDWTLAKFLHDDIGPSAKPFLEAAAQNDRNPVVRKRAQAELRRY